MAILIINPYETICGDCGEKAFMEEDFHVTQTGILGKGCGAKFDCVGSDYINQEKVLKELRPALEYIPTEKVKDKCKSGV